MCEISANWFSRKLDFSISVFCAVSAETKLETETFYRDAFAVVVLKRGNHEKKRGSCGSRLLIWTKLVHPQTVSFACSAVFCGNETRNGFAGVVVGFSIASNVHMLVLDAVK